MAKLIRLHVLGQDVDLPEYIDCPWCGKKESCKLNKWWHETPCESCRSTSRYETHLKQKELDRKRYSGMNDALNSDKPAAIWTGKGKDVITNNKGNIIAEVDHKPRPLGKKDWKW